MQTSSNRVPAHCIEARPLAASPSSRASERQLADGRPEGRHARRTLLSLAVMSACVSIAAEAEPIGPLLPTTGGTLVKNYEIYHDAADPSVFYARRTQPVLATAQAGGFVFQMQKFEGETANFGGSLAATVALENNPEDFKSDPNWSGKDIRSMPFVADGSDQTYIDLRDDNGKPTRIVLEATTDAQNRISFHIPMTKEQAERVWQTRTGNTLPVTLFLRRHVLGVGTDLQVSVTIDYHELYTYFEANASVGFWIFQASYKQVRETHNIDNFIHVKTFAGETVSGEKLEAAQEEAWKRIKENLFREAVTPNPAPSPPLSGWPKDILDVATTFYNNFKLATGSGYLTAEVVDIRKQYDAHYEYTIDQKRQERREVSFYYDLDISALQPELGRYFFLVQKFPQDQIVSVDTLPDLLSKGAQQVKVTLWQSTPSGNPVNTQALRFNLTQPTGQHVQSVQFHPAQTQTLSYKYRVNVGLPDQDIQSPVRVDDAGSSTLTVPSRTSDFYAKKVVDFLTSGKQIAVQRGDLAVTYTRKSDKTSATLLVPAERRNKLGAKFIPDSLDLILWDCDDSLPISYEFTAMSTDGKFYSAGVPSVQARAIVQMRPLPSMVAPLVYKLVLNALKATKNPLQIESILDRSIKDFQK